MCSKSNNEVLEILKYIPLKDYAKIPREEISKLRLGRDESYSFSYDVSKKFSDQHISRDALIKFTQLYYNYIANESEKTGIGEILDMNRKMKNKNSEEYRN